MDLKFPHHECEIAQATAANGKPPVKYWIHSNMLTVNGQKMSKSLGNSFLPHELFSGSHPLLKRGYSAMSVRFFMLQSHYSSTLDFSNEALEAAEKGYKKLANSLTAVKKLPIATGSTTAKDLADELNRLGEACYTNMSDDFNTAKTLAVLFEMSSRINDFKNGIQKLHDVDPETFERFKSTYISFMEQVLGLSEETESNNNLLEGTINVLIGLRKKARQDKNFALSDRIRDDLKAMGIQLMDGKDGDISYTID